MVELGILAIPVIREIREKVAEGAEAEDRELIFGLAAAILCVTLFRAAVPRVEAEAEEIRVAQQEVFQIHTLEGLLLQSLGITAIRDRREIHQAVQHLITILLEDLREMLGLVALKETAGVAPVEVEGMFLLAVHVPAPASVEQAHALQAMMLVTAQRPYI